MTFLDVDGAENLAGLFFIYKSYTLCCSKILTAYMKYCCFLYQPEPDMHGNFFFSCLAADKNFTSI